MKEDKGIKSVYDIFCETLGWEIFSESKTKVDIQNLELCGLYDTEEQLHPGFRFDITIQKTGEKPKIYKNIGIALGMTPLEDQMVNVGDIPRHFEMSVETVLDAFGLSREKVFKAFQFKALELDAAGNTFVISPRAKNPTVRPDMKQVQAKELTDFQKDVLHMYLSQDASLTELAKDITKSLKQENLALMRTNAKAYVRDFFMEEERKKSAQKAMGAIEACLKKRIRDPKLLKECLKDIEASLHKQVKDGNFIGVNILDIDAPSQNPRTIAVPNQKQERTR